MERMTSWLRPRDMTNQSRIRGVAAAALLCAALAGCGTAAASTTSARAPHAPGVGGAQLAAAPEVGCASVDQATSVNVERLLVVGEPVNGGMRTYTQRHTTLVRALFGDFCAAITHADVHQVIRCPADFGVSYVGAFHDGQRILATFIYSVGGCPRLTLTAAGKTRATLLIGKAAAAAPHLKADFAAVLKLSESQVYGSPSQTLTPARQGL
jgi:hypothetical protein